ncbi:hypothetical protein [Sinomicrobium sp. M5D2P9]
MTKPNFDIKVNNHYKLYVFRKDQILFESELQKNGIKYYTDINEQSFTDNGIRYFLLTSDRQHVDRVLKENGIVANTESLLIGDFRDRKKILKLFGIVTAIVTGIVFLIVLFGKWFG